MAREIVMPKLGNTVESVIIIEWKKDVGDSVAEGEPLCEVETDKTTVDVEAEVGGTLLAKLYDADAEVPVLVPFAVVGDAGEDVSRWTASTSAADGAGSTAEAPAPDGAGETVPPPARSETAPPAASAADADAGFRRAETAPAGTPIASDGAAGMSPRARKLAASAGLEGRPAAGTGPGGRIIERDVKAALEGRAPLTRAAAAAGGPRPDAGSGIGGRVTAADRTAAAAAAAEASATGTASSVGGADFPGPVESIPVRGVRKLIAQRMHASLLETAQLTLNATAPAASLLAWRSAYKDAPEDLGLSKVSINDLVMTAVARLLPRHPELNATYAGGEISRFRHVHLGFAVDTPKGLMVPVIRFADRMSLGALSAEARRLAAACRGGTAAPDELSGGTFTITNLGAFGVESFTPVLNAPEVAILGVGAIINRPTENPEGGVGLEKRLGLSLTIDHQVVDGAPGARFLKDLSELLGRLEWAAAL